VTVTGDDGVERPSVLHCVNARLFATKQGEPLIVRSGVRIVASSEPGAAQVIRYSDAADVEGVEFVAAPAVIALDGHESTIELAWRDTEPDAQKCRATFVVRAADAGSANVSVRFEQFEGGVLVREVKDTTLHLAKGEKALVITKPPAAK
jgi:hypothetical protein